ncbi:MAG: phosphatidylinositol-4,5-bisphosphate 4-phosphatase [Pseudomonadota bacterium]|nr:phosphatidylinositol-4,5-bisphosphate 4-phosphatase [Pseudomonadota bacterium]
MAIDIQNFRNLSGVNRVLIDQQLGGDSVQTKGSHFLGKAVTWLKDVFGGQGRVAENLQARNTFYNALVRAEGQPAADRAMTSVLGRNWNTDFHSLSGREVQQVLDKARHIRMDTMGQNQTAATQFGNALALPNLIDTVWTGVRHTEINVQGTPLGDRLDQARQNHGYPEAGFHDRQVFERFMGLVAKDPDFPRAPLTTQRLEALADQAITEHYQQVQANFDKEHPGLAQYGQDHPQEVGFRSPSLLIRLEGKVQDNTIAFDEGEHKDVALNALKHLKEAPKILGELSFDHSKVTDSIEEIEDLSQAVQMTRLQLDQIAQIEEDGQNLDLLAALHTELETLAERLEDKRTMLTEFKQNHPFSEKNVAYTRFMLAETGKESVFTHLSAQINDLKDQRDQTPVNSPESQRLQAKLDTLIEKSMRIMQQLDQHVVDARQAYQQADPNVVVPKDDVAESPLFRTEKSELAFVNQLLKDEGLDKIDKKAFQGVRDQVLNTRQDWSTVDRTIVTQHQRTTQVAHSVIDSGINLDGSYTQKQLQDQGLQGVSSHTKTAVAPEIPKNLQHSKLVVDGETKVDMLRHGIIANEAQAKSVVSTAIWSDPVLRDLVLDRLDQDDNTPINYAFSNVNLESPWSKPVGLILGDRRGMQDDHIAAFKALANAPQPVEIPFVDRNGVETTVRVNLKVSVLAIPVNNAVGILGKVGGVWSHVEGTNREGLQNLVGDLGDPSHGVEGSARGTPVGGMIGDIARQMDQRIQTLRDTVNPTPVETQELAQLTQLRGNVQEAVDIIRDMYCSGNYKDNDGNRYKFALAVMFANSLAKQAHTALELSANGDGFGSSQGCMSNKDRGGNADALLKSLNLSSEHAFKLLRFNTELSPNEMVAMLDVLPPEEAKNMLLIGLGFTGQFENQKLQTLVMGSKNAGDLMQAIKNDPEAYPLLKGLSSYGEA